MRCTEIKVQLLDIWKKMNACERRFSFKSEVYYYRSLFKEAFSSLDIRREDCMRQVSLSHATGRRHAWVTYLRAVFRSRRECERVRASAMQAPPWMNSRRRLERDSCVVYVHAHVCACSKQACRATDEHSRWWRTVNAERDDYPLLFRYRTNHFLLEEFTSDYSARFFHFRSRYRRVSTYQRWSAGTEDTWILRQIKHTRGDARENYSRLDA